MILNSRNSVEEKEYLKHLKQSAERLQGQEGELAQCIAQLAHSPYVNESERTYGEIVRLLGQNIANSVQQDSTQQGSTFLQPLVQAVRSLTKQPTADFFAYVVERALLYPHSNGYNRRPFRTRDYRVHLPQIVRKLASVLRMEMLGFDLKAYLSLPANEPYPHHEVRTVLPDRIAYALDTGDAHVQQVLTDIIYGEQQHALLSGEMIKGMLMSSWEEGYRQIGELLVAARLQEGLRQSIVERMDEGTVEAFIYMLRILIDHELIRFSSVVRAMSVWTGMALESANQRVAAQLLEQALQALSSEQVREEWLREENANRLLMSLWATAVLEEQELAQLVPELMKQGQLYQQVVSQYVLANSQNRQLRLSIARQHLHVQDPELIYWVIMNYDAAYTRNWGFKIEWNVASEEKGSSVLLTPVSELASKAERRRDFELFRQMLEQVPPSGEERASRVLDYVHYHIHRDDVVRKMLYLAAYDMDSDWIAEIILLKDQLGPDLRGELLSLFVRGSEHAAQRNFIFESLSDKSMSNREHALAHAKQMLLGPDEMKRLEELLKLKTGSLRQLVIQVLLLQNEAQLDTSLARLLQSKSELQRLGALEILTEQVVVRPELKQEERVQSLLELVTEPTPKEKPLLDKLRPSHARYTLENGFGLFDPSRRRALLEEVRDVNNFRPEELFTLTPERISTWLEGLDRLVHEHRDYEYEIEYYAGYRHSYLLGTRLQSKVRYNERKHMPELDQLPLSEVWHAYFRDHQLTSQELLQLFIIARFPSLRGTLNEYYQYYHYTMDSYDDMKDIWLLEGWRKSYIEQVYPVSLIEDIQRLLLNLQYKDQVKTLIEAAYTDSSREDTFSIAERYWSAILHLMPEDQVQQEAGLLGMLTDTWAYLVRDRSYDDASFQRYFQTAYQAMVKVEKVYPKMLLSLSDFIRAYELSLIDEQEIYYQLLAGPSSLHFLMDLTSPRTETTDGHPRIEALRDTAISRIVELELLRGELPTELTEQAMKLGRLTGIEYWVRLVAALDQDSFVRGYIYSYGNSTTRKETFSYLIRNCHPRPGEGKKELAELLQQYPLTEKRLLEAAMYAPQWLDIVSGHLGWEGLHSAAWYFHAHINEHFSAEKETVVACYSPISAQDFNDGAFDIRWFNDAYATLGAKRFKLLYDCAKYISGGANHRRSQLFADAVLGELSLEEMHSSVVAKRNKDHLLAYSLIPLAPSSEREQDVRGRYDFVQQFLKESKKFGAQRKASEGTAAQIALDNLARNAGYDDVTRLTWDMEASRLDGLEPFLEPYEVEPGLHVKLEISREGQTSIVAVKQGKELKSLPSRVNKHEHVVRLKELKGELTDQYRRARQELERSMVQETVFTAQELFRLIGNPVLAPLLQALVFRSGDAFGYLDEGQRCLLGPQVQSGSEQGDTDNGELGYVSHPLESEDQLVIAHPLHLFKSGLWHQYQRNSMEKLFYIGQREREDLKQREPFKQVFRELYLPNEDELANGLVSNRYAGYQVQPNKTVSLLKQRQWTVSYEEGLQRVDYQHNLIARLYAMADWFSPADTESPTLETVQFFDRKTNEPVALKDVHGVLFSEVMRDLDLVVSVAYVGGVDPEASLTTIEMRRVIVKESLRLLKLENVRLEGNYAHIAGELGEYAVHLGSGSTFKQAAGDLYIVPVHSQHRGRIFLPFLDEDPKTAEILSKIVLLAEDRKIKDPQILEQLRS